MYINSTNRTLRHLYHFSVDEDEDENTHRQRIRHLEMYLEFKAMVPQFNDIVAKLDTTPNLLATFTNAVCDKSAHQS
jgi:hypothetical protein